MFRRSHRATGHCVIAPSSGAHRAGLGYPRGPSGRSGAGPGVRTDEGGAQCARPSLREVSPGARAQATRILPTSCRSTPGPWAPENSPGASKGRANAPAQLLKRNSTTSPSRMT